MLWCPKCRFEYRPGFTDCPVCRVPLEEKPMETKNAPVRPSMPAGNLRVLVSDTDQTFLAALRQYLEEAGIPSILEYCDSAGSYVRSYMGVSPYGQQILVAEEHLGEAMEILKATFPLKQNAGSEEPARETEETASDASSPTAGFLRRRRIMKWIICIGAAAIALRMLFGIFLVLIQIITGNP